MKVLINLTGDTTNWLAHSRMLALAIKPHLEANVLANQLYLRGHRVKPLYYSGVRYKEEPLNIARVGNGRPERVEEFACIPPCIERGWGDCFPGGTVLLREGHRFCAVEEVQAGDRIWGINDWVTVEAAQYKGMLPVTAVRMNNGSTMTLTDDHHVYVLECPTHGHCEKLCSCAPSERREIRVRVSELEEGMVLASPERIAFGTESFDPDRAYIEGLYVSDGWSDKNSRFAISGKNGFPKEEQKAQVERICKSLGIHTRQHSRYIAVNDGEWALRMQQMGGHAPEKRMLSLNLDEGTAAAMLRGVMADSGKNTNGPGRTFTTTSRLLAMQMRVMHRMFGMTCGYSNIENHGGLGKHPIHRLNMRQRNDDKQTKLLRVKDLHVDLPPVPCWDIQTSDHHVYLPEHDVTVSNCDDLAPWRCAELREHGEHAKIRITWRMHPVTGLKVFHVVVRRENGSVEDPSLKLGMRAA